MKKFLFVFVFAISLTMFFTVSASASGNICVYMNDDYVDFDVPPQIINGRTLVPVRAIFENLGATVNWDGSTRTITSTKGSTTVTMQIDNATMQVNGTSIPLDTPPQIINGRTLVPVRAVAEAFGNRVMWDDETSTIIISDSLYFKTPDKAHSYLANWLLANGEVFSEYVYIQLYFSEREYVMISYYPHYGNISLDFFTINDSLAELTKVSLEKDGSTIYTSGYQTMDGQSNRIQGMIDRNTYSSNYPLSYEPSRVLINDGLTVLQFVEITRKRINYLLKNADILLAVNNTGVSLNALGFKNY